MKRSLAGVLLLSMITAGAMWGQGNPCAPARASEEAASTQPQLASLADFDREIEKLLAKIQDEPDHPTAWSSLVGLRTFQRALSGEAQTQSQEESVAFVRDQYSQWIEAQPSNAWAYMGFAATLAPSDRADYLVDALQELGDSFDLLACTMVALDWAGQTGRKLEIAYRFTRENPLNPEGYELAHDVLTKAGQSAEAADLLEVWLQSVPGDGRALEIHYRRAATNAGAAVARRKLGEHLASQIIPGERAIGFCRLLRSEGFPDLSARCFSQAIETGLGKVPLEIATAELAELGHVQGTDAGPVVTDEMGTLASKVIASSALRRAETGDCPGAVEVLDQPAFDGRASEPLFVKIYGLCGHEGPASVRLGQVVSRFDDWSFASLIRSWPRRRETGLLEQEALRRLQSGAGEWTLWKSLDSLYADTSRPEDRKSLFELWRRLDSDPSPPSVDHWIGFLAGQGDVAEVESLLTSLTERGVMGYPYLRRLAELRITAGRFQEASELVRRMHQWEAAEGFSPVSDYLGAQLAWSQGDLNGAERSYRRYIERALAFESDAFREYSYLLVGSGRQTDLFAALEDFYEAASRLEAQVKVTGSMESWVAERLEAIHLLEPALDYLDRAHQREPQDGSILERSYRLAARLGDDTRALAALESLVRLDPSSAHHRDRLAELRLEGGGAEAVLGFLDQLPSEVEDPSGRLRKRKATALVDAGRLIDGIRLFRELEREEHIGAEMPEALRRAYLQLARDHGEAPGENR